MAISPEALLIFSAREEDQTEASAKKAASKKQPEEPMLPSDGNEKMLAKPATPTTSATTSQTPQTPSKQETKMASSDITLSKFDLFRDDTQKPVLKPTTVSSAPAPSDQSRSVKVFTGKEYVAVKAVGKKSDAQLSREAARKRSCIWHPWREAYAICTYCHRPFCFEDTVEFNRSFYCLEDIDNVSSNFRERISESGNTIKMLAGVILIFAFLTYFYFSNAQILSVLQSLATQGLPYSIFHINASYAFALLESLLIVLALINGLLLFGRSTRGVYSAFLICLSTVALFTYQYTSTGTFYLGLVAGMVFISLMILLYSRTTYINQLDIVSPKEEVERNLLRWPNVGKF